MKSVFNDIYYSIPHFLHDGWGSSHSPLSVQVKTLFLCVKYLGLHLIVTSVPAGELEISGEMCSISSLLSPGQCLAEICTVS